MQNQKMPCGAVPKCNYDLDDLFWSAYTTWWQPRIHYYFQGSAAAGWNNRPGFLEKSDHHDYFIAIRLPHQFDYESRLSSWKQFEILYFLKVQKPVLEFFLDYGGITFFWMQFYTIHIGLFRKERLMLDEIFLQNTQRCTSMKWKTFFLTYFEAFRWSISSVINLLFLKSD